MWKDKPMPKNIGFVLSALFLLMAFFQAWKEQKVSADRAGGENLKLGAQIDELTKSAISGTIDFAVWGAQPENGSHAALIISLSNSGASSAVEPGSWKLVAITRNKTEHTGRPITLLNKNLDFCLDPMHAIRFVRNDALYYKASTPIPRNGFLQGVLWYALPGLERSSLVDPSTTLVLQGKSVSGQPFSISSTVQQLIENSKNTKFVAGIENPDPLEVPCKENVPY
jgi:hypothetical protein